MFSVIFFSNFEVKKKMWSYKNPVKILFGNDQITCLASIINGRQYALVTYSDGAFEDLTLSLIHI